MNVTNIYLARHGETEYNRCNKMQGRGIDASLNETGIRQAYAIARHLQESEISIDGVYSSSLKRSKETAAIVAESFDLQLESYEDLDEIDFGIFEGCHSSQIESNLEALHQKWKSGRVDCACENGESPRTALRRANRRIETILRDQAEANLLFVLHGRLLRILLSHWLEYGLQNMHRVSHSNGALYHIRRNKKSYEPVYLNKTEHLNIQPKPENFTAD